MTRFTDYSIHTCKAGWFVKRDKIVIAHGFATEKQAKEFVENEEKLDKEIENGDWDVHLALKGAGLL